MFEFVKFGEFSLCRVFGSNLVYWVARCDESLAFKDDDDAEKVRTAIKFHGIVCEACNP